MSNEYYCHGSDRSFEDIVDRFVDDLDEDSLVAEAWAIGTLHDDRLHSRMAEEGWVCAYFPSEYGGRDATYRDVARLYEVMHYRGLPIDGVQITEMAAYAVLKAGSESLKRAILPEVASGKALICLGLTEPDAGSDLASVRTIAERSGDGYVIRGAKMFTTLAHVSDYVFLLARTDPNVDNHAGLSTFLVPIRGNVEIRAVDTFGGERTNATFYDDIYVPSEMRVGEENNGWRVVRYALDYERSLIAGYVGQVRRLFDSVQRGLGAVGDMAQWYGRLEAASALADRVATRADMHLPFMVEASMAKLLVTETFKALAYYAIEVGGVSGLISSDDHAHSLEHVFRHSHVTTIYGGTSEVQRELIAARRLLLPAV